jgi:ubiquinone/menaquinone biosynthesis C-methylase UbiE
MSFKDHFSKNSNDYGQFRPAYPPQLFVYLAGLCNERKAAWDCATGSGQAATELSKNFSTVYATDASAKQIENAEELENVEYKVAAAESSGLPADSVSLTTVAQALHWFDLDAFAQEAQRVTKPNGVLSAWTYNLLRVNSDIDKIIDYLYSDILGNYWPLERRAVENGYADMHMPFSEINSPEFEMTAQWMLADLTGYLKTWSAVHLYTEEHKQNPVDNLYEELLAAWGSANATLNTAWPLSIKVWRI